MKNLFKTALLAVIVFASAKTQAQSVSYKVTKNDPYDIKNFSLAIDPFFMDFNSQNGYSFGWGLRADYMMGKALLFNFDYRQGFGTKGYLISDNNTRNFSQIEGSVAFTLSNKVQSKNLRIILSQSSYSSGGYTYTTTTFIKGGVPGDVRSVISFRAGFYQLGNAQSYKALSDSLMTFENSGTELAFDSIKAGKAYADTYGGYYSTCLFGGFNFRQIRQLYLDVEGYGQRGNVIFRDFYADFLFSPVLLLKNYSVADSAGVETKYDVKYGKKSVIGWRLGWFLRKPKDQGFSMKFEFGQRPTFINPDKKFNGAYCLFTYGLYIPLKIKPIAEREG